MLYDFINIKQRIPEGIRKLKKENNLYLYGNGSYANYVYTQLMQWNININGVIVSDEYQTEQKFHEFNVKLFSELNNMEINIIVGYDILKYEKLNEILLNSENIKRIYNLDGNRIFAHAKRLRKDIILIDDYYRILLKRNLDYLYFKSKYCDFLQTYEWLMDEKSKMTMECYLQGHIELKDWPMISVWNESDIEAQYFPQDVIQLTQHEVFVDCGAYTGDTLETFSKKVNAFEKYYALEPDSSCFTDLDYMAQKMRNKGDIIHMKVGVSEKKEKLFLIHSSTGVGQVVDNDDINDGEYIELDCIDNLINQNENVSFIKMDIEGSEMRALKGAKETIKKYKPKMAICVYHKREDLITIPQYIKSLVSDYKFFLRAHSPSANEVVLYCVY